MSLNLNQAYVSSHWSSVETGAEKAGRKADRAEWRMVREVFAENDTEAAKLSVGLHMGGMMREYFIPLLKEFNFLQYLKHDQNVPDSDVTAAYCAKHNWFIGSPATVTEKIQRVHDEVGDFGHLLVFGFDDLEIQERGGARWGCWPKRCFRRCHTYRLCIDSVG
jgi:alkanesulfonate monooxygenase SsuD/methylene tetrahydromethanopterin reductase-like flavin-dependent oxidoreductase (luciferase family)